MRTHHVKSTGGTITVLVDKLTSIKRFDAEQVVWWAALATHHQVVNSLAYFR